MTEATYAGTTGWSGTDTSREQADPRKHVHVQSIVLSAAHRHGTYGITVADLRRWYPDIHHGSLSSALTNLHRAGRLARLVAKRDRCHIYMLPEHVQGQPTEPPTVRPQQTAPTTDEEGEARGRRAAAAAIGQHINAMLAAMPTSSASHHERCWQKHPACALIAVRKVTLRMGEEGPL